MATTATATRARQELAARLLASGGQMQAVAKAAGVSGSTLRRWKHERQFLLLLGRAQRDYSRRVDKLVRAQLARQLAGDVKRNGLDPATALRIYAEAAGRNPDE